MRWNLGLAGLATAWGLIAVLARRRRVDAGAARVPRGSRSRRSRSASSRSSRGRLRAPRPGPHLRPLIALGIVQAAHWWLFFEAVKRGSVALAVLTFYTAPIFLAVLAPLFLPERLSNVALGALVPGGIGIALVALAGEDGARLRLGRARLRDRLGAHLRGAARALEAAAPRGRARRSRSPSGTASSAAIAIAPALFFAGTLAARPTRASGRPCSCSASVFTGLSTLAYAVAPPARDGAGGGDPHVPRARLGRVPRLGLPRRVALAAGAPRRRPRPRSRGSRSSPSSRPSSASARPLPE